MYYADKHRTDIFFFVGEKNFLCIVKNYLSNN